MTKQTHKPAGSAREVPWARIAAIGAVAAAIVLLVVVVIAGTLDAPSGGIPEGTRVMPTGDPLHVNGDFYQPDEVPAGGQHNPIWANCGFYSQSIRPENAVHSLEHGAAWITYRPDIAADDLAILRSLASPVEKVLVSPVLGQESPIMATAWGYQLDLETASDERLDQFIVEFAGSLAAPEPGGACTGGVGSPG